MARGLSSALHFVDENLRYPFSVALPLSDLKQEFAYSPNHQRKLDELGAQGYCEIRRVRGDGNCFFRALGFAWLESLCALAEQNRYPQDPLPTGWPQSEGFGELAEAYRDLRRGILELGGPHRTALVKELQTRLLGDARLDLVMVLLVRLKVVQYFHAGCEDAFVLDTVQVQYGSVDKYLLNDVALLGKEAEGVTLAVAARQFCVKMRILQLDSTRGALPEYVYPSDDYSSPLGISVSLLFRPGHYEVLYHNDSLRLMDPTFFYGRCSFCREQVHLASAKLMVCFHRLCAVCSQESGTSCPICSDVPLVEHRPSSRPSEPPKCAELAKRVEPARHLGSTRPSESQRLTDLVRPTEQRRLADVVRPMEPPASAKPCASTLPAAAPRNVMPQTVQSLGQWQLPSTGHSGPMSAPLRMPSRRGQGHAHLCDDYLSRTVPRAKAAHSSVPPRSHNLAAAARDPRAQLMPRPAARNLYPTHLAS